MKASSTFFAILTLVTLSSCQTQDAVNDGSAFDFESASEMIDSQTRRFTEAHITGDLEFLDNVFSEDARVYPPGSEVIAGRAKISEINAQYVAYGISEFEEVSTARFGGPDFIVDEGTYTMTYGPDDTSEAGYYVNIWKRVDDDWKLFVNTWTTLPGEKGTE